MDKIATRDLSNYNLSKEIALKRSYRNYCIGLAIVVAFLSQLGTSRGELSRLTVDSRVSPALGIDSSQPEFGWILSTPGYYDVAQVSRSIQVASTREGLGSDAPDCWQSGEVASSRSFGVPYEGKPLESSKRYYWRATVRWRGLDGAGKEASGEDSACGEFVTGVMPGDEWGAKWITSQRTDADPLPILFRNFKLDQPKENVAEAILHVCGLGQQIVSVNSLRVGDRTSIDPGWTNYKKSCLYTTFDVKKELTTGDEPSISVVLGNGMYNVPGGRYVKFSGSFGLPKAIAKLTIRYQDGSTQTVVTDKTWQTTPSPVVFSCVYGGPDLDFSRGVFSRNRLLTWGVPKSALETEGPGGVLKAQNQQPVVVLERLKPLSVKQLEDGKIEADFGYNFAGRPVFRCVVPRYGQKINVTLAEMQGKPWNGHSDGYFFNAPSFSDKDGVQTLETAKTPVEPLDDFNRDDWAFDFYPDEIFGSTFGYWGFQYVYIDGAEYQPDVQKACSVNSIKPQVVAIEAERIGADLERVGSFESDGAYLNEIDLMIDRSVRSNVVSLMTDCPHREKLGWLEETHLMGPSILYRYDLQTLFRKICRDMTEAQLDDGMIPDIAPEYTRFVQGFFWSAEWSSAAIQVPWLAYRWYGDEQIISEQYDTMNRYVRYMASIRNEQGLIKAGLGDWYDWSPEKSHAGYSQHTPGELTATAFFCDNLRVMAIFAEKLGKSEDAAYFRDLREQAVKDFQRAYFNAETSVVATGSQASYGFALYFDLIPLESRAAAFENMLADIEKWNYRPSCGEVAWPFVIKTLASFGRNDVLWKMLQREDAPGYVHMLKHWGMKTLSETWDGPGSSMNHFMFGAIQEWFSSDIVGIRQADDSVGFDKILLRPSPMIGKINRASGDYRSIYGTIRSDWSVDEATGAFAWNAIVPAGTTAELAIPVAGEKSTFSVVNAQGEVVSVDGSTYQAPVGDNPARRLVKVGSGDYKVVSQLRD